MSFLMRGWLLFPVVIVFLLSLECAKRSDAQGVPPPPDILRKWEAAGFRFAWATFRPFAKMSLQTSESRESIPVFRYTRNVSAAPPKSMLDGPPGFGIVIDDPAGSETLTSIPKKGVGLVAIQNCPVNEAAARALSAAISISHLEISTLPLTEETKSFDDTLAHLGTLRKLETINFGNTPLADGGLRFLLPQNRLRSLNVSHTKISDVSVIRISKCVTLEELEISYTSVTFEGLRHLASMESLARLAVGGNGIADKEVMEIAKLKQLKHLEATQTSVTSAGIAALGLLNLESLKLDGSTVSDADIKSLARLQRLKLLSIPAARISASGIRSLATMRNLESLNVSYASVSEADLFEIAKLPRLRSLQLNGVGASPAFWKEMHVQYPNVRFIRDAKD